ncbi:class I SAM-dependent methyltransferase [Streptomyces sp. H39-S7]|uniref:class I SAM-dependent methyltransferase n=1 Tax=Streptomyces sp. H39-S7 TaxID=3004357 RepID=UPI0022AEE866|nr:class I SAM-dependent methyltransferase [Streptomyces sp. H39-S7]MCZ4121899.1 class I SAM-dependent methyltransferase [Streptomyces sp. H39-S7]
MAADWQWDDTLFAGTAAYYHRGRLPYAPGLADLLAEAAGLDGRGRLLDVGCGPGTVALGLAHLFAEIVGVDPDGGMIAEAERGAARTGAAPKARWVRARAEDLPAGLGTFTVATFGQSFHWMDQDLVAATIKDMLLPGGVLVHISDVKTEDRSVDGLPHPAVPYDAMDALVRQYLGPVRRAGRGVLPQGTPGGEAVVLTRAGFAGPQRHVVPGGHPLERTVDDVVAWAFSLSSSAPHLFGARRVDFEADLRRLLTDSSPAGRFSARQPGTEVFLWRKSDVGQVPGTTTPSVNLA